MTVSEAHDEERCDQIIPPRDAFTLFLMTHFYHLWFVFNNEVSCIFNSGHVSELKKDSSAGSSDVMMFANSSSSVAEVSPPETVRFVGTSLTSQVKVVFCQWLIRFPH